MLYRDPHWFQSNQNIASTLFVLLVVENKVLPPQLTYIRPSGPYWNDLKERGSTENLTLRPETYYPKVPIKNYPTKGVSSNHNVYGLPVYGIHHMDRPQFGLTGGFCPQKGGDFGRYPYDDSGAGFPSNYEEVTPICDGFLIDMKFWANLWSETWEDPDLLLGNAGFKGELTIEYLGEQNVYGRYTGDYLKRRGKVNPYSMDFTRNGEFIQHDATPVEKGDHLGLKMNFTRPGTLINFNEIEVDKIDVPECPASCQASK